MLDLLQSEHFRKELMNSQCARFIDDQQLLHWQHYQRKRTRLLVEQADRNATSVSTQPQVAGTLSSHAPASMLTQQMQQLPAAPATQIQK